MSGGLKNLLDLAVREPALLRGLATAAILVLGSFGLVLANGQEEALIGLGGAVLSLYAAFSTRGKVSNEETVDRLVRDAYERGRRSAQRSSPPEDGGPQGPGPRRS